MDLYSDLPKKKRRKRKTILVFGFILNCKRKAAPNFS